MDTVNDTLEKSFPFPIKATIYNNMDIALTAYRKLLKENENLFKFKKSITAKGHLMTLFVEKQFNNCSFSPSTNYSVYLKTVNKYKHQMTFIEIDDFIINIARTTRPCILPPESHYKKRYAKNNRVIDSQYELVLDETGKITDNIELPKKYAFLTYSTKFENLEHLEIIVPSYDYKGFIGHMDLGAEAVVLKSYIPEEVKEEAIVSLKESMLIMPKIV